MPEQFIPRIKEARDESKSISDIDMIRAQSQEERIKIFNERIGKGMPGSTITRDGKNDLWIRKETKKGILEGVDAMKPRENITILKAEYKIDAADGDPKLYYYCEVKNTSTVHGGKNGTDKGWIYAGYIKTNTGISTSEVSTIKSNPEKPKSSPAESLETKIQASREAIRKMIQIFSQKKDIHGVTWTMDKNNDDISIVSYLDKKILIGISSITGQIYARDVTGQKDGRAGKSLLSDGSWGEQAVSPFIDTTILENALIKMNTAPKISTKVPETKPAQPGAKTEAEKARELNDKAKLVKEATDSAGDLSTKKSFDISKPGDLRELIKQWGNNSIWTPEFVAECKNHIFERLTVAQKESIGAATSDQLRISPHHMFNDALKISSESNNNVLFLWNEGKISSETYGPITPESLMKEFPTKPNETSKPKETAQEAETKRAKEIAGVEKAGQKLRADYNKELAKPYMPSKAPFLTEPTTEKGKDAVTPPPAQPSKPEADNPVGPPAPIKPERDRGLKQPQPGAKNEADKAKEEAKFLKEVGPLDLLKIDKKITYGEIARQYNTTVAVLNELNALELVETTVLAVGSEVYVPISKKTVPGISPAPNTIPAEKPAESEPVKGLSATFEAFKMTPEKREIIDKVLSTPGLRFSLNKAYYPNEEGDLTKFRFDGKNIIDPKGNTDIITGISVEQGILIVSRAKGRQLHFQQDTVSTEKQKPVEQTPAKIPAPAPAQEKETKKSKIDFSMVSISQTTREEITEFFKSQKSGLIASLGGNDYPLSDFEVHDGLMLHPNFGSLKITDMKIKDNTLLIDTEVGAKKEKLVLTFRPSTPATK